MRVLINPVDNASFAPGRHSAVSRNRRFFTSNSRLLSVSIDDLTCANASLAKACEVDVPDGELQGLLSFDDTLLIGVQTGHRTQLWSSVAGLWEMAGEIAGQIGPWTLSEDGEYAFFVEEPFVKERQEPRSIFSMRRGDRWRTFDSIWLNEAQHVHSMSCVGDSLVILVGDAHFNHFFIKVLGNDGKIIQDPRQRVRVPLGLKHLSLYRTIQCPRHGLVHAKDGRTELLLPSGESLFIDSSLGCSGYQIAAHAFFEARPDVCFFGTWRRSFEHPYPCFYAFNGDSIAKFAEDSRMFAKHMAWTGFQDMDNTIIVSKKESQQNRFWPNPFGKSISLVLLTEKEALESDVPILKMPESGVASIPKLPVIF